MISGGKVVVMCRSGMYMLIDAFNRLETLRTVFGKRSMYMKRNSRKENGTYS